MSRGAIVLMLVSLQLGGCLRQSRLWVFADPDKIRPGEVAWIRASLEGINEPEDPMFRFHGHGTFSTDLAETSRARRWTAPNQPGDYTLFVDVQGKNGFTKTGQVVVSVRPASGQTLLVSFEAAPEVVIGGSPSDGKLNLNEDCPANQRRPGGSCIAVSCLAANHACRIRWSVPPGNVGSQPGLDLRWAKRLSYWARGEMGGEEIWTSAGAERTGLFPSSLSLTPDPSTGSGVTRLSRQWELHTIALNGDLSNLPVLFDLLLPVGTRPLIIYLDDIKYEQ